MRVLNLLAYSLQVACDWLIKGLTEL